VGTIKEAMEKVGLQLSVEDSKKVKTSISHMKKKFKRATCRNCGEDIKFLEANGRMIPHDKEEVPHWQTCSYSPFAQKNYSLNIMKKLAILSIIKLGLEVEREAGLTRKEAQVVQAVLEKAMSSDNVETGPEPGVVIDANTEDDVIADLVVVDLDSTNNTLDSETIGGDDPIGDPDEELAPTEAEILKEKVPE